MGGSSRTSSALSASSRTATARGRSATTVSAASASRECVGRTSRRIKPRVRFAGSPCFCARSRDDHANLTSKYHIYNYSVVVSGGGPGGGGPGGGGGGGGIGAPAGRV